MTHEKAPAESTIPQRPVRMIILTPINGNFDVPIGSRDGFGYVSTSINPRAGLTKLSISWNGRKKLGAAMKVCASCGSTDITESKLVMLAGQPWHIRDDGYRFWAKPAEGNSLKDREERMVMEYKHNDGPANELAKLFFSLLPDVTL